MLFAASKSSGSPLIIIIYVIVFGGLYFFYLRPRSRKQKAARQQTRHVEVGEKVRTIGGMIGTVVKRTDEAVTLRTDSGYEIEFIPSAIAGKHVPPSEVEETETATDDEEHSTEGDDK
jgi:preprotein translocase subunit YajC